MAPKYLHNDATEGRKIEVNAPQTMQRMPVKNKLKTNFTGDISDSEKAAVRWRDAFGSTSNIFVAPLSAGVMALPVTNGGISPFCIGSAVACPRHRRCFLGGLNPRRAAELDVVGAANQCPSQVKASSRFIGWVLKSVVFGVVTSMSMNLA